MRTAFSLTSLWSCTNQTFHKLRARQHARSSSCTAMNWQNWQSFRKVGSSLNLISSASVRKTPKLGRKVRFARLATEFSSFQGVCRKVMLLLFKFLPLIIFLHYWVIKVFVWIQMFNANARYWKIFFRTSVTFIRPIFPSLIWIYRSM